ncbi:MAG: DUF932 domain-containing protein [Blastocatellia bacterium]|nr:DUF932 domain-containing protein [Blastocatellia bacterium]
MPAAKQTTIAPMETIAPVGLVPFAAQLTEREQLAQESLPWNSWEEPAIHAGDLALLRIEATGDDLNVVVNGEAVGRVTAGLLDGLGVECTFPDHFVAKLSPRLAAQVINERIDRTPPRLLSLVTEGDRAVRLLAGDREVLSPLAVADRAYSLLRDSYRNVEVECAERGEGEFLLRLLTQHERPITPKTGDILTMGAQIEHNYRDGLKVCLYVRRLVCLNGMTADSRTYSWKVKEDRSESGQMRWLDHSLEELPATFERLTERAKLMAETPVTGHPRTLLQQAARSMGLSRRLLPELFAAYDAEPEPTQWGINNAVTRLATHSPAARNQRQAIWSSAGDWVDQFDICTATLPRSIARSVGANIIE